MSGEYARMMQRLLATGDNERVVTTWVRLAEKFVAGVTHWAVELDRDAARARAAGHAELAKDLLKHRDWARIAVADATALVTVVRAAKHQWKPESPH